MIKAVFDQHQDSNQLTSDLDLLTLGVSLSYGFFSSHAANAFALMFFIILMLKPAGKFFSIVCVAYACLTSYSRIYLGVHYPADILAGALCGLCLGFLFFNFTQVILNKWNIKFQSQN